MLSNVMAQCFKPFQGLFCISTTGRLRTRIHFGVVSNPSRDYSAFLQIWSRILRGEIPYVSNPSRDYSAFLQGDYMVFVGIITTFQTLPGIILHFYTHLSGAVSEQAAAFQTLPGIILHFYSFVNNLKRVFTICFKPFQGLFCISTITMSDGKDDDLRCFKPFQGLFCISTVCGMFTSCCMFSVSNPSRDYSAFLRGIKSNVKQVIGRFQTLPGIILHFYARLSHDSAPGRRRVSNPSRDYSAFLRSIRSKKPTSLKRFKPFQGLFCISTRVNHHGLPSAPLGFKPFQGLFCISTLW